MNISKNELKQFAFDNEADLVGAASVERFLEAPAGHKPGDLLAGAKSVIACAQRIPGSTLVGPAAVYHRAMEVIHMKLDQLAFKIALFLENTGGRALPIPSDEPYHHWEPKKNYGRGDLSHKHAAQAAGLGKLGKNSLLITPKFGNMVHLVSVVTDIYFEPDFIPGWEPCPKSCNICRQSCPVGAIGEGQMVNQSLCRPVIFEQLPKGMIIESCSTCRQICPIGIKPTKRRKNQ